MHFPGFSHAKYYIPFFFHLESLQIFSLASAGVLSVSLRGAPPSQAALTIWLLA